MRRFAVLHGTCGLSRLLATSSMRHFAVLHGTCGLSRLPATSSMRHFAVLHGTCGLSRLPATSSMRHFAVLHDACSLSRLLAISLEAFASALRSSLLRAHTYFVIETRRDFCMLRFDFHRNSLRYPSAEDIFGRRFAYPTIVHSLGEIFLY